MVVIYTKQEVDFHVFSMICSIYSSICKTKIKVFLEKHFLAYISFLILTSVEINFEWNLVLILTQFS